MPMPRKLQYVVNEITDYMNSIEENSPRLNLEDEHEYDIFVQLEVTLKQAAALLETANSLLPDKE